MFSSYVGSYSGGEPVRCLESLVVHVVVPQKRKGKAKGCSEFGKIHVLANLNHLARNLTL